MDAPDLQRMSQMAAEQASAMVLFARQWLDRASAEDVVQEALVRLLAQQRPPVSPAAWMYRTVRNAAIDQARSSARRRRREQAVAGARQEWFEPRPDSLLDAKSAELALGRLGDDAREIVVLRIWSDLSFTEIAEILHLSVSTVHGRYRAALGAMRLALEKPCQNKTV